MKSSSSRARAWLQRRNKYTLDRPSSSPTMIAPSSPFLMSESTGLASASYAAGSASAACILDPPLGLSSSSSTYTLDRVRHSSHEFGSSSASSSSSSFPASSSRYISRTKSTPTTTTSSEPWLGIAAGGILSFAGLMWLGEIEAAAKEEETRMLKITNDDTPVTNDPHVVRVHKQNNKTNNNKKDLKDDHHHPGARTKAEWFRPF